NPYKQVRKARRSKHHEIYISTSKQEVYDVIDSMAVVEVAKLKQRVEKRIKLSKRIRYCRTFGWYLQVSH
ncbi:MAG: hypothetical protein QXF82_08120, partial [Nitrososphaeria archaeon]